MSPTRPNANSTWIAFSAITLLLLLAAWITIENTRKLRSQSNLVVHTNEVVRQLQSISLTASLQLIDARRNLADLGSDAPGDSVYADVLDSQIQQLRNLVADNEVQRKSADLLQLQSQSFKKEVDRTSKAAATTMSEFGNAIRSADESFKELLDKCNSMRDYELQLLGSRSLDSERIFRSTIGSQIASSAIGIISCYVALALTRRIYRRELEFAADRLQQEEQTIFLLNSSGDGICGLDQAGTCTIINESGAKMLGYSPADLLGQKFLKLIVAPADDQASQEIDQQLAKALRGQTTVASAEDTMFRRQDGSLLDVAYTVSPWKRYGQTEGVVISYSDIRERKTSERQVERARQEAELARQIAEEANTAKSNFLANMSHELRTPLNAVIMYSEMLQEDATDMQLDVFAKDLSRIHVAGRHLLALVNGVLDLAKIEAGKMELFIEEADIEAAVEDVVNTVRNLVEKNSNEFVVHIQARGTIQTDVTKFRQILLNLLSNAAKFTSDGKVQLTVSVIDSDSASSLKQPEWLLIEVKDDGVGIPPDKLSALFVPFVQAEKSTSKDYGGTGLGLALVKQFVELMGGEIDVESNVGSGSTFTVRLPRNISKAETVKEVVPSTANIDVVIIDDDQNVRDFVSRALRADGIRTMVANDGEAGFELVSRVRPRLVVLDVLMPKMDGWTVLSKLKADAATTNIPVVLLTIAGQTELGYSLGAQEYLMKPVSKDELIAVARRLGVRSETPTLLVIDDDPGTQELVSRVLAKEGWQLSFAENGKAALNALQSDLQPDMILLDLQMPVMDGFDFLEALRAGAATTDAPIVVLTSLDLTSGEKAWLSERVATILEKGGQSPTSLLEILRSSIKQRLSSI